MSAGKREGRRMLRRPEPSARRPIGAARCLGEAVHPRVPVLNVELLGSREDCHCGPVACCVQNSNRLEDEVRSEEERVGVRRVCVGDVCPQPESFHPGSGRVAR
eukprot:7461214-Alexandrium_andersonii.AAC.1